jgi:outer membrane protein assembly factor BamB
MLLAQVPVTDLYLFQLTMDAEKIWHAHSPTYLSGFNDKGYTNQPEFITDDVLYVSVRSPHMEQNDIFSLNTKSGKIEQVTSTDESEFSPLKMPDGRSFSCVRQVHGDDMDQQLFSYPIDRSLNGSTLFSDIKNIGYHCWLNDNELALFLVNDPSRLATANVDAGTHKVLASKIGRSLHMTPDGKLAYVHKYTDEFWYLKTMDPKSGDTEIVTQTLPECEDFVISSDGYYFMGQGSELFVLDPRSGEGKAWQKVADLGIFGVEKITRLAMNARGDIAVVSVHE